MKILTNKPIAIDSPDHIKPWGTMRDNHSNIGFVEEIENYFNNKKIHFLDLGCSGGKLVEDFFDRGHLAIGLEGSDYSAKIGRACWGEGYNKYLFTCDCSEEYFIVDEQEEKILFDCITAWEVIEHIHPDKLNNFFKNIYNHLKDDGIVLGTISLKEEIIEGVALHQSVFSEEYWKSNILNVYFDLVDYSFVNKVRGDGGSFYIQLKKKKI